MGTLLRLFPMVHYCEIHGLPFSAMNSGDVIDFHITEQLLGSSSLK
jgi:hypothetical protein